MNRNEILIIFVLCILLIIVIIQIGKSKSKEKFNPVQHIGHNFPFPHDECSHDNYIKMIGDIHVNYNRDAVNYYPERFERLHIVHPENPCCLRTCINDFTYTKDNIDPNNQFQVSKIGKYKDYINKNLYFASKCDMCLNNFYVALKRLGSDQLCEESQVKENKGNSMCSKQI